MKPCSDKPSQMLLEALEDVYAIDKAKDFI